MEDQARVALLVVQAKGGDREAFDRLVERFRDRLRSTIEGWSKFQVGPQVGPQVDSDDVLQETFLRAFRSLEGFDWQGDDSFFRWLCGIAKRALAQTIQDLRKSQAAGGGPSVAGSGPTQTKIARRVERFDRLEQALQSLSPEYREVLLLSRVEGLKTKEIAQRLKRTPNAVKHLMARALVDLRSRFGDTESLNLPRDRWLEVRRRDDEK